MEIIKIILVRELNNNQYDKYKDYIGKSLFVLSLFVLALMIFLIIQKPFLHIDEWFTRGLLNVSFKEMVSVTAGDVHPPLYYAIALVPVYLLEWLHIPYDMIFVMKMVSVAAYVLLFAVSITKIREDYGWLAGGLFALTLLTMSNFFTMFSIARMYPWGMFFLVMAFIFANETLKNPKLKNWILLAFFSVCGAYTHYFVAVSLIIIYVLLLIYYIQKDRTQIKNWLISTVVGIICYAPWLVVLYRQMKTVKGSYWIEGITIEKFLEFFATTFVTENQDLIINVIFAIVFLVIFVFVVLSYKKSEKDSNFVLFGFLVFIATILFGVIVSAAYKPILVVRYLAPATGLLWLCISVFISKFDLKKVVIPVVVLILLFSAVNLYGQVDQISKNHDELVKSQQFLDSINNNDSVVIIDGMVKYIHFHDQLNKSKVYNDFSVDERKEAKGFTKFYDDEKYKFMMTLKSIRIKQFI